MALSKNSIPVRVIDSPAYEELNAAEAGIYPGMIVERVTATTCRKCTSVEKKTAVLVAIEDALQGAVVTTAYTNGTPVRIMQFRPGEEFHAYTGPSQTLSINEKLISKGDGQWKSAGDSGIDASEAMVECMEAITPNGLPQLCRVRVL